MSESATTLAQSNLMPNMVGPWLKGVTEYKRDISTMGKQEPRKPGSGAIATNDQQLSTGVRIAAYKLNAEGTRNKIDYYAIAGRFRHGVKHPKMPYIPSKNWVSVGYYATYMVLELSPFKDSKATVYTFEPQTPVETKTTNWAISIGAEVAKDPKVSLGASFGGSYESPNVKTQGQCVDNKIRWEIRLPGVEGGRPNPEPPSYYGFEWNFGAIWEVPAGTPQNPNQFELLIEPKVTYAFDYTRGITYDTLEITKKDKHIFKFTD